MIAVEAIVAGASCVKVISVLRFHVLVSNVTNRKPITVQKCDIAQHNIEISKRKPFF